MKSDKPQIYPLPPALSIIVPMLNEIEQLPELMAHLLQWERRGHEVLLIDDGSNDNSESVAKALGFKVFHSHCGRAIQINAGAARAKGSASVFLHADTRMHLDADSQIIKALKKRSWGRFDIKLSGDEWILCVIAFLMNFRSRSSGIATGNQAIFIDRAIFFAIGGFPEQPLMEDIEISKRLKRRGRPQCLQSRVTSSGHRWVAFGVWPTICLMWRIRWAYWRGTSANQLAKEYQ